MDKYKGGAEAAKVHTGAVECRRRPCGDRWTPGPGGKIILHGRARAITAARRRLVGERQPALKTLRYSAFPTSTTLAA
jgi:hypothetical protein